MAGQLPEPAVEAGLRGATRIADRVVAKIAAQAAREALRHGPDGGAESGSGAHAAGRPPADARGPDAVPAGAAPDDAAAAPEDGTPDGGTVTRPGGPARDVRPGDADATVVVRRHNSQDTFGEARVRVSVELGYPGDIGAQCGAVRRRVTERVWALAGMTVPEVAIQVTRLHSPQLRRTGQGRVR
ncbi:hypothetical protein C3486_23280 [Streptomyces sp. Ru73]|uniref:hypothetical protein n=1 Tax=Streptomyces sp. Ru73 TaxID=2080748 RepID=UPI000CDE5403|nr:hypothetical protein C3486_23280 [Streptomyces sp. Ru73]